MGWFVANKKEFKLEMGWFVANNKEFKHETNVKQYFQLVQSW